MQANVPIMNQPSTLYSQFLIASAWISATLAVIGLVFIVIFYAGIGIFGPLNDIAYTSQLAFTLPIIHYVSRRAGQGGKFKHTGLSLLGLGSCSLAIALQLLLIFGVLTFFQMIGFLLATISFLVLWFVLVERASRQDPVIPTGWPLAFLAGLTFGYPFWAVRFSRNLQREMQAMVTSKTEAPA